MNIELIQEVIHWLKGEMENTPEYCHGHFTADQDGDRENWCGTSMCVAGYVTFKGDLPGLLKAMADERTGTYCDLFAGQALGLSPEQANWLFYGAFSWESTYDIEPQETIRALEFLLKYPTFKPEGGSTIIPFTKDAMRYVYEN